MYLEYENTLYISNTFDYHRRDLHGKILSETGNIIRLNIYLDVHSVFTLLNTYYIPLLNYYLDKRLK